MIWKTKEYVDVKHIKGKFQSKSPFVIRLHLKHACCVWFHTCETFLNIKNKYQVTSGFMCGWVLCLCRYSWNICKTCCGSRYLSVCPCWSSQCLLILRLISLLKNPTSNGKQISSCFLLPELPLSALWEAVWVLPGESVWTRLWPQHRREEREGEPVLSLCTGMHRETLNTKSL